MPIPPEIRNVPRPVNTIVVAYGKNKDRYGVRKRIGCKYVDGKRRPVNGPTIGHIIDGGEWQFPRIRKAQLKVLDALGLSPE